MKTILVPLDGSSLAEQVLPYVCILARAIEARIVLLRVITDEEGDSLMPYEMMVVHYGVSGEALAAVHNQERQHWDAVRERVESYLENRAEELRVGGLQVETMISFGSPARQIVQTAEHEHADLIAMATHDYNALQRWTYGSITDRVAHTTHTPFFIVRGHDQDVALAEKI